jgi:hypothetical protein
MGALASDGRVWLVADPQVDQHQVSTQQRAAKLSANKNLYI